MPCCQFTKFDVRYCSGIQAVIGNNVLIIAGSMVGAAGLILTFIMCKAMNRTLQQFYSNHLVVVERSGHRTKVGSDPEEVAMVVMV